MNDLIVDVKLWGESVGSLYWEKESNAALFDYERKFIRSGLDISPIIMPISQYSPAVMIHRGGRIPAPMQALKN